MVLKELPDHVVDGLRTKDCLWRYGKEVFQCSFFIVLTFLKRWRDGFCCFCCKWFRKSFVSSSNRLVIPRLRFRIISYFWNFFFFDAAGLTAAVPSTRQGMDPLISLETLNLRRLNLLQRFIQLPSLTEAPDLPWLFDAIGLEAAEELWRHKIRRHIHHCWSRLGHILFSFFLFLNSFCQRNGADQAEIFGTAERAEMADVEQMEKIVPLVTCEVPFGQDVCDLLFGVNVTDLNFRIQIDPVKQTIQSNSVGSWNMSHCGTSTFDNHLNCRFIVLKDIGQSTRTRFLCIGRNVTNVCWNDVGVLDWDGSYACLAW